MVMRIYLYWLCTEGVNCFNDFLASFYARQWYDVTNDVTRASLTVEDRLLIKALHIKKGWRCGSNDCRIAFQTVETTHVFTHERTYEQQFLVTTSTSINKHRYKNKLLGLLLPPPWRKTLREVSNFIAKILILSPSSV